MTDVPADVLPGTHVDFEVLSVFDTNLLVRFRVNDKHLDQVVIWDGKGDVLTRIASIAMGIIGQFTPPPSFELLQQQVGKQGHVIVPPIV